MKQTPIVKVPEAWTAVVDHRVEIHPDSTLSDGSASVYSSDRSKHYIVKWRDGGLIFTSTDPTTYWQGYAGYPVLAVLMTLGRLTLNIDIATQFAGVEWKAINTKFKNNYVAALDYVERQRSLNSEVVNENCQIVLDELSALEITVKRK